MPLFRVEVTQTMTEIIYVSAADITEARHVANENTEEIDYGYCDPTYKTRVTGEAEMEAMMESDEVYAQVFTSDGKADLDAGDYLAEMEEKEASHV